MAEEGNEASNRAPEAEAEKRVPLSRLRKVTEQRKAAEARLQEAERQLDEWRPQVDAAKTLRGQIEELQGKLSASERGRDTDRALASAGITDPWGAKVADLFYSGLPEENKPSLTDWLADLKEKPDTAPAGLRVYLAGPEAPAATEATESAPRQPAAQPAPSRLPDTGRTRAAPASPTARQFRPGDISKMSKEEILANMDAILAQSRGNR
jgi:hypothetical protein